MKKTSKNKHNNVLTALTVFGAAFVSICYAFYLLSCISQKNGFLSILLPLTVIVMAVTAVAVHKKIPRKFASIICAGMLIYAFTFTVFFIYANTYKEDLPADDNFVIIVFGAKTNGYIPGRSLTLRLVRSYELLSKYPDSICVVSGGQGSNETVAEAEAMERFLIYRGISDERIYKEKNSSDTIQNISNSSDLIKEKGFEKLPVVCVSSRYHLPRIKFLSAQNNLDVYIAAAKNPSFFHIVSDTVREYMAWIKLFMRLSFSLFQ